MKLRHDPFNIFRRCKTPAGLYASQKGLYESDTAQWRDDFQKTVFTRMAGQSADGSWQQSPLASIRCLFGLHLTVRHRTEEIEKALGWLIPCGHRCTGHGSSLWKGFLKHKTTMDPGGMKTGNGTHFLLFTY